MSIHRILWKTFLQIDQYYKY